MNIYNNLPIPENLCKKKTVYIAGAGPGDMLLVSIKTFFLIQKADVIIYDYLANPDLLKFVKNDATLIYVGKKAGDHTLSQDEINDLLAFHSQNNSSVLRLKGGDPFIFGRGGEEALFCYENNIEFEIIPGITASTAVPAYCGIPVTHRNTALTFGMTTGHESDGKKESQVNYGALAGLDTIAIYMGTKNIQIICNKLIEHGKPSDTPACIIQWGTFPDQKSVTGTLKTLPELCKTNEIAPPSIIVIGKTIEFSQKLNWFNSLPLKGKNILVTRTRDQAGKLSSQLRVLGANVIEFPVIKIIPPTDKEYMNRSIKHIKEFDIVIFTSENGVSKTLETMFSMGMDIRTLGEIKIASIGSATSAKLKNYYITTDVEATDFVAESLYKELKTKFSVSGKKIALFRSEIARPYLKEQLTKDGAIVSEIPVYNTVFPEYSDSIIKDTFNSKIDMITFTSSSTVENFFNIPNIHTLISKETTFASIGPVTSQSIIKQGKIATIEAKVYTISGLVEKICFFYKGELK